MLMQTQVNDDRDALLRRQKLLADFGDFSLQSEDLNEVLTEACRVIAEALNVSRGKVLEIEEDGKSLFMRVGVGWSEDIVGSTHIPMGENSSESFAIKAGRPVISRNIHEETRFDVPDFMKEEGVVALANVPIFLPGKRAYGLLQVDHTEPRDFDESDTEFLRTYAAILGPVVDRLFKIDALSAADEQFRLTVEAATDYAILMTDRDSRITDWLPGASAVFGWSAEEVLGRDISFLFTPEDRAAGVPEQEVKMALETGSARDVRDHLCKDGSRVFIEGVARVLHDTKGNHRGFIKIGQDASERRESDRSLRESEERYRLLTSLVPALLWQTDALGCGFELSPNWLDYTGQTPSEAQGTGWLDAIHPEDRKKTKFLFAEARLTGEPVVHQHRISSSDGAYRWFLIRQVPQRDDLGWIQRWFGAATDIHELHEMQARQEVMVAELQHRTRNLIGVVQSISNQTMARTGPTEAFRKQFNARLASLSRVQGLLSRADQEPITLRQIFDLELEAVGASGNPNVTLDGPTVTVRPILIQTLALAIHELATNARKHGALSANGGRLDVTWKLRGHDGECWICMDWQESGLVRDAPGKTDATDGFGRQLIERALPHTLGAQTSFDLGPDSLRCTIELPRDNPQKPKEVSI